MTVVGIDFDNTIAGYDEILHSAALARGLIDSTTERMKKAIRDAVRLLPGGEIEWQKLQAEIYGPLMKDASLISGAWRFMQLCKKNAIEFFIVSHKTEYATYDANCTNLRAASFQWMKQNGFFDTDKLNLTSSDVFFESTRSEKIERIKSIRCTHFIDDLEETFLESEFPEHVEKILYSPVGLIHTSAITNLTGDWNTIIHYFFNE